MPTPSDPFLQPLSSRPSPPRNLENAGNTCYLSSVLVALFADFDACDALLTSSTPLCAALRTVINPVRRSLPVPRSSVRALHASLVASGWHPSHAQQDAAELFAFLLDILRAPFLPLFNHLRHLGLPDPADHVPSTERLLWLSLPAAPAPLRVLLDDYFLHQKLPGLRRGTGAAVDARLARALLPFYTPLRETGESVPARRAAFPTLTLPLAVSRFHPSSSRKRRDRVSVPTALDATLYVAPPPHPHPAPRYTLILRSVVCHLGQSIRSGHYVAYTYGPRVGWRRWNDLDPNPVRSVRGTVATGEPEDPNWADEIARDCYLLFYELVPGDGEHEIAGRRSAHRARELQVMADAQMAAQRQVEEDHNAALKEQVLTSGGLFADGSVIQPLDFWPKK